MTARIPSSQLTENVMEDPKSASVIDGDGHVFEDIPAIWEYFPTNWRNRLAPIMKELFPPLDHLHHSLTSIPEGSFQDPGSQGWVNALDALNFAAAVLYPTQGLAIGRTTDADLAVTTCAAYNDWLTHAYLALDPRLKGVALLPLQDPQAAAAELDRTVSGLGFVGGLLPTTGLKSHLGDSLYWPVYEKASRLGCSLSVHGGGHSGMGFDHFNVFAGTHALGHPVAIAAALAGMTFNGVFQKFPEARFAFLEGGVGWFAMAMERFDESFEAFPPINPRGKLLDMPPGQTVSDHIRQRMNTGHLVIGVEGEEPLLGWAVREYGNTGFMYTSDYPHEVTVRSCRRALDDIRHHPQLSNADKTALLGGNASLFYGINS
ncbi:amidohydrolase family protein [Streptomyces collinus]|uniref:amidohydrolase family protein n=1 Tax=Streptomyces collinus TaxID=42684 RepID=UPI0036AD41A9